MSERSEEERRPRQNVVKLSLIERTLNLLGRAERKRHGDFMTRQAAEVEVLRDAFAEARRAALEEAAQVCEAHADQLHDSDRGGATDALLRLCADRIRERGGR